MRPRGCHWRLEILPPIDGPSIVVDPDGPPGQQRLARNILMIEDLTTGALGDCIDASIQVTGTAPSDQNMARMGWFLHVSMAHDGEDLTPLWRGRIIEGRPPSSGRDPFTLVATGLKQELYDIPVTVPVVGGGDAALVATRLLEGIDFWPGSDAILDVGRGLDLPQPTVDGDSWFPLLGLEVGDRFPGFEMVGDGLDAIADMLPSFVVPSGETYTYDGTTYSAGDRVPAVRWGVNANGRVVFGRPQGASVETASGTTVQMHENVAVEREGASGEDLYDRATIIYQSEFGDGHAMFNNKQVSGVVTYDDTERVPHPIARTASVSGYGHTRTRLFEPEGPMDFMERQARRTSLDLSDSEINNPTNAFDQDPDTYAEWDGSIPSGGSASMRFGWGGTGHQVEGFLILDMEVGDSDEVEGSARFPQAKLFGALYQVQYYSDHAVTWKHGTRPTLLDAPTERGTYVIPCLKAAGVSTDDITYITVWIEACAGTRLYEAEFVVPDEDLVQEIAEGIAVPATRESGDAVFYQALHQDIARVLLRGGPFDGETYADAERTTYFASNEEGYGTRVRYGAPLRPDALNYRRALERLIRRETRRRS